MITETVKFGFAREGTVKVVDAQSRSLLGEQSLNSLPADDLPLRIDARLNKDEAVTSWE